MLYLVGNNQRDEADEERELFVGLVVAGRAGTCWACGSDPASHRPRLGRSRLVVCTDCGAPVGRLPRGDTS
jgi:hypothetical protein